MTVYVLGAGASLHAGYPLAPELSSEIETWACSKLPQASAGDAEVCGCYTALKSAFPDDVNDIEKLMTRIQKLQSPLIFDGAPWGADKLREGLVAGLVGLFRERQRSQASEAGLYAELAKRIRTGDTLITFNYDCALERELGRSGRWDIGSGYGFPTPLGHETQTIEVLKLHGSINWYKVVRAGPGPGLGSFPEVCLFEEDLSYLNLKPVAPVRGWARVGFAGLALIMPGAPKEFYIPSSWGMELMKFWDRLWDRAAIALRGAHEVVIIGYGLPEHDERARELLRREIDVEARIVALCKDRTDEVCRFFRSHGFEGIASSRHPTFEGWLEYAR